MFMTLHATCPGPFSLHVHDPPRYLFMTLHATCSGTSRRWRPLHTPLNMKRSRNHSFCTLKKIYGPGLKNQNVQFTRRFDGGHMLGTKPLPTSHDLLGLGLNPAGRIRPSCQRACAAGIKHSPQRHLSALSSGQTEHQPF